jgi:raffinose/stachyose/melibiose transport system substrate-binding protein
MKEPGNNKTKAVYFRTNFFKLALVALLFISTNSCKKAENNTIELVFTSWRIDDVEEMNRINAQFTAQNPNIKVKFYSPGDINYDSVTISNLSKGVGADLIFLWSYDRGRALYDAGYLADLTTVVPNLNAYPKTPLAAWTTETGITYGSPSVGVTHGVYYNKSLFSKYQIQEPTNWTEFLAACEILKINGETVIAQGSGGTGWTLNRVIYCGLGANFYGGETARQALINGTKKLTDANFIDAFNMVNSLKKYFPTGYETLDYEGARDLFAAGKAAIFIGGSWEISLFNERGLNSTNLGWFAPPLKNAGDKLQYCFQVDAGIGVNKQSKNYDAAITYLKWLSGIEYGHDIMNELPGFFSYTPGAFRVTNLLAQEMFDASKNATLTVRLMDEKLSASSPTGDAIMSEGLRQMILGILTPEQAAAYVQSRLK